MTVDEMIGWHHRLNGYEFEQTPGGCEEQERLACCNPWGRKESGMSKQLNDNHQWAWGRKQEYKQAWEIGLKLRGIDISQGEAKQLAVRVSLMRLVIKSLPVTWIPEWHFHKGLSTLLSAHS